MKEYQLVRHGYHQDREIQTGIGSVSVKVPRSRYRQTENCQSKRLFLKKYCLDDGIQINGIRSENWIRLHGFKRLAEMIEGVQFVDGIPQSRITA